MQVGVKGAAPQGILPTIEEIDEEGDKESASICHGGGSIVLQRKVEIPEQIARGLSPEQ